MAVSQTTFSVKQASTALLCRPGHVTERITRAERRIQVLLESDSTRKALGRDGRPCSWAAGLLTLARAIAALAEEDEAATLSVAIRQHCGRARPS